MGVTLQRYGFVGVNPRLRRRRGRAIFGCATLRRALAIVGCMALLYFAAGGTLLHHHTGGPETACQLCQALHAPALAAAPVKLIPEAQQVAWHAALPESAVPS